ncbi:aminotransferase class I/II-fold pyridoxal phosphate-dependent enzyme [Ruegeria pomeroyi]|uniref:Aminotransferase, classes I and II n=3 Tax=Ruegeria pomeroyi TaxID=89184 RepID=Q5LMZ5_RUEPO|nr:aminotransferase class I/II-fold pyridoxal phosphate-dependent enzyme [Ruegeria pomeroyi]AAV96643.1 aminotransferase, classes I and II [Ruegeria pomeroyi DSS-3]NVK98687.1 aminotransferase class I/II-fold pyridoxal phosphate-dependent enzyme [Ruegeria pomeroyi]QWV10180.1 aminotransferase class I/II-fold pyridoxal phosphate-dependent enzyme [Ruegeria pomeroyi]
MNFPERFSNLPAYAFPRLRALLDHHPAGGEVVHMTIGEPKHAFPAWVTDVIVENAHLFQSYPPNEGSPELRGAITDWIARRYGVTLDPEKNVMALNGTREGLYNAAMALCPEQKNGQRPIVLCPNPFYQVYMVAAISVGAEPHFVPATAATGHLPDYASLPVEVLNRTAVAYICSPANPQGAVASREYWAELIGLAEQYDFRIFADECYSEIYREEAPAGALSVAQEMGADPERVVLFNSLSKRSNLAGLRSGLIAGGPETLKHVKQLRNYSGAPLPGPLQAAAARVWADEAHVAENRALYQEKYALADQVFAGVQGYQPPEAGFFLWLPVDDGEAASLKAWRETGVRVLPGAYLAQGKPGQNPGETYIRVAMVAPKQDLQRGLIALRDCIYR